MAEQTSRQMRLATDDFRYTANIGVYGARVDISVFDNNTKSAPIIKVLFTYQSAVQFRTVLKKIVADPESKPIEMTFHPFNRDLKVAEFRSSVTVGRDTDKCIYLDLYGDRHKEPVRFYVIDDRSYRINGMEMPKQSLSEQGCTALIELMTMLLMIAAGVPRNASGPDGQQGGGTATPFPVTESSTASTGTDVSF